MDTTTDVDGFPPGPGRRPQPESGEVAEVAHLDPAPTPAGTDDEVDSDAGGDARRAAPVPETPPQPGGEPTGLTDRERQVLVFERQWWKHAGAKEQAIRDRFEVSTTRYYQLLNALLDKPAAAEFDPVLVGRLRRLRATRSRRSRR